MTREEELPDVRSEIQRLWAEVLECDPVNEEADFFACGGTSIKAVDLAAALQERFVVLIDAVEVLLEPSVAHLTDLVVARLPRTQPDSRDHHDR